MLRLEDVVILMNNVNYLIGSEDIDTSPLVIFDDMVCEFYKELSSDLLGSPLSRVYKDLSALAFWARPAHIKNLKKGLVENETRIGRGLCFHIAPSNIPINFAFSYVFSLLAGNANIVRLPSKDFPQIDALLSVLNILLDKYPDIKKRTAFVRYPVDNEITAEFSLKAHARMIWGGDKTIASIRTMPTSPRCVDIAFADRYSVCIIDGQKINNTDEANIKRLAEAFYNDTYLMDQNACSSPQLILWQNSNEEAKKRFWTAVFNEAKKQYDLQDAVSVNKYFQLCEDSINLNYISKVERLENLLYRIELTHIDETVVKNRGKGGYFYEYSLNNLVELFNIVTEKFQTVTQFGLDVDTFKKQLLTHHVKGIDRVVPIGKAMDIGTTWDGYNLINVLSRVIHFS